MVNEPLFDAFIPWEWIIPVLHVMTRLMNSAFSGLLADIEERYKYVTEEEREARRTDWKALYICKEKNESLKSLTGIEADRNKRKKALIQDKRKRTLPTIDNPKGKLFTR